MDLKLAGKTALVSGADTVMADAVATQLVAEGAAVVLWGDGAAAVEALAGRLRDAGGTVTIAEPATDAAALPSSPPFELAWLGHLTSLDSMADAARLVEVTADHLAARGGGSMVLQSTTAALLDVPAASAEYAAAGAAVLQLTRQVAVRRAGEGVRANAVCPGGILAPSGAVIDAPAVALAGPAPAADVAELAVFLLSPLASYTTGQAIVVDGGASII